MGSEVSEVAGPRAWGLWRVAEGGVAVGKLCTEAGAAL